MEIEILCTKLIKPSSPTLSHNQCYKLSFFDQIAGREHLPVVLFYHYNNFNSPTIDERLEKSLSNVLTHVYPAAGRYDKDECSILCLDQGVPYTKAKVNSNIEENIVVKRFVVHEAALSRLKKQCIDESGGALNFQPSRVEIITAILWRALIRISAVRNGYFRPSLMDFPLNLRSKSSLPQVNNSMGNFRIDVPIKFMPGETKMELHHFIILIRNTLNKVIASCTNASPDEIVSTLVNIYNESFEAQEWGGNDEVDKVGCSSMCKFPLQDIDFGLGKPSLVYFGLKDKEIFWLYDTDRHTEVGVQLDLKESCMQLFECDNDIKALMFIRDTKL
uniref:Anthocyanin acyltransferase n=1 Tax=Solanum tuberosum TaxID=4113 RepID=M1B0D8_SOLTU